MAALLPPSSIMARANLPARRGATDRPMAVEPVADTRRTRASSTSVSPSSRPPKTKPHNPAGTAPKRAAARRNRACVASAVSGVFSDGFQTKPSPQTSASAAFQAHTATGKLKLVMIPTTPRGCHVSIIRWPARSVAIVSP